MRPWLLAPVLALLLLPASAAAQAEAPVDPGGGVEFGLDPRPLLEVARFRLTPGHIKPGERTTVRVRVDGGLPRARLVVTLSPRGKRRPVDTLDLGKRRTGRTVRVRWTPRRVPAGAYVARLRVAPPGRQTLAQRPTGDRRVALRVVSPPPPPPAPAPAPAAPPSRGGVFPVRGQWTFGGPDARFGAGRNGHIHQGQDVAAPEGTPLVSPYDGTVFWRAVQEAGAGHYLIVRDARGWDYVFMHLQAGSETVQRGDRVSAGQQIGRVGSTGDATGPHLHFEVWPGGWQVPGSQPIDPLPLLEAWARATG
jgi:murein DD-endopeptidase MepM/ murein hydrolase activator NlpD